tara:strand:- start:359 stop:1285 length:927 start_codon:yes stop_codon:yes gene_type:complete
MDVLSAFSILFLFLFNNQNKEYITKNILNTLSLLLVFSILCVLYYLSKYGFQVAQEVGDRFLFEEDGSDFKLVYQSIALSLVLLPFIWFVDFKRKLAISLAFILFTVINLVSVSRGYIAGSLISILYTIYIGFKLNRFSLRLGLISSLSIILFSTIFILNKYSDVLLVSFDLMSNRFDLIGDEIEPRDVEAEFYFKNLSNYQLFFGKGIGAANLRPFGRYSVRGIMMMHRGENNLILKGGLLFLFIIYGLAIFSLFKLLFSKDLFSNSWAGVIIIFLLLERGHQQYSSVFMLIFLCLAISYSFALKNK